MKKLIPLMILATVVSCGKKTKTVEGSEMIINKLTDSQKVGLVSLTTTQGETANFDYDDTEKKVKGFNRKAYTDTLKKITLKKENSLVYILEIQNDEGTPESRRVVLQDLSDQASEIQRMIDSGEAEVKGDFLFASMEDDHSMQMGVNGVMSTINSKMKIKSKKSLKSDCESKTDTVLTNVIGKIDGKETKLDDGKQTAIETCGAILSKEELKEIDLSSIRFCDDRIENNNCENNQDMSFLTSDL